MDENVSERRERLAAELTRAVEVAETNAAEWGRDDCVLWVANIVQAALGYDPVPTIRGKYADMAGAYTVIGKQGLAAGMRYRARKFGWQRVKPEKAEIGDLGVFKNEAGVQSVVLKFRGDFWAARAWRGIALVRGDKIVSAWRLA